MFHIYMYMLRMLGWIFNHKRLYKVRVESGSTSRILGTSPILVSVIITKLSSIDPGAGGAVCRVCFPSLVYSLYHNHEPFARCSSYTRPQVMSPGFPAYSSYTLDRCPILAIMWLTDLISAHPHRRSIMIRRLQPEAHSGSMA